MVLLGLPECVISSSKPNRDDCSAAAKSLQLCPTLCDPTDGSPPGSPVPGILQARTLEWVAISFFNAWKWKEKVKSLSHVQLLVTPWTAAYQAPLSMGFSRQEYWSRVPIMKSLLQAHLQWCSQITFTWWQVKIYIFYKMAFVPPLMLWIVFLSMYSILALSLGCKLQRARQWLTSVALKCLPDTGSLMPSLLIHWLLTDLCQSTFLYHILQTVNSLKDPTIQFEREIHWHEKATISVK